jgi:hypothetical protein
MKKIALLFIVIFILTGPFLSIAYSLNLELQVKDFECEDGKIVVHYGLVNTYGHDFNNVTLGFKVMEDEKSIACKQLNVVVPKDADGLEINEVVINTTCSDKKYSLKSSIFIYGIKRYKIEEWFSDCN